MTWRFGVGHFIVGMNWIATAFTYQAAMPAWLGVLAVIVLSLYLALFPALAGLAAWHIGQTAASVARDSCSCLRGAWILGEYLRATLFTGFRVESAGVVLLPVLPLAHAASWMGIVWVVGARAAACGSGVARDQSAVPSGRWRSRRSCCRCVDRRGWLMARQRRQRVAATPRSAPGIPIRIVQPNIHQDEKYVAGLAEEHAKLYARSVRPPTGKPRLLLWPEAATLRFLQLEPDARDELRHAARSAGHAGARW